MGDVVIGAGLYFRLLVACILTIALIWTSTVAVFLFLSALYPGEDHDFEGAAVYVASGCYLAGAVLCGFLIWRYRHWILTNPASNSD